MQLRPAWRRPRRRRHRHGLAAAPGQWPESSGDRRQPPPCQERRTRPEVADRPARGGWQLQSQRLRALHLHLRHLRGVRPDRRPLAARAGAAGVDPLRHLATATGRISLRPAAGRRPGPVGQRLVRASLEERSDGGAQRAQYRLGRRQSLSRCRGAAERRSLSVSRGSRCIAVHECRRSALPGIHGLGAAQSAPVEGHREPGEGAARRDPQHLLLLLRHAGGLSLRRSQPGNRGTRRCATC